MIMPKGFRTAASVGLAALSIGVASTVAVESVSARSVPSYQQYDVNAFTSKKNILCMALHNLLWWNRPLL